jgi:hypothetical protein
MIPGNPEDTPTQSTGAKARFFLHYDPMFPISLRAARSGERIDRGAGTAVDV